MCSSVRRAGHQVVQERSRRARQGREVARAEQLSIERTATTGGLIPEFASLASAAFDPARVDHRIRDFYEHTTRYRLDTWATTYFPARLPLWLLVTTISRRVHSTWRGPSAAVSGEALTPRSSR